jgi:hypothetical protein
VGVEQTPLVPLDLPANVAAAEHYLVHHAKPAIYRQHGDRFLDEAEWVVSDVDRVLGRPRGIRIGEAPDRDMRPWRRRCSAQILAIQQP